MTSIYNLPQEVEQAIEKYYSCFDLDTGELTSTQEELEASQKMLEDLQNRSDEILQWYLQDRANRKARSEMIESEIKRLSSQLSRESKAIDRSEHLIERAFERVYEGKAMNIGTFTLSYRKSEAVSITDENIIPSEYLKTPEHQLPKPDKTLIKSELKDGKTIPGVTLEVRQNLQIK